VILLPELRSVWSALIRQRNHHGHAVGHDHDMGHDLLWVMIMLWVILYSRCVPGALYLQ
jgi:hypothetical protein